MEPKLVFSTEFGGKTSLVPCFFFEKELPWCPFFFLAKYLPKVHNKPTKPKSLQSSSLPRFFV
jgi:hypothetical protein